MQPLFTGKHLRLCTTPTGWEYVQRTTATGVVVILAVTDDHKILLVEQHRPPIDKSAIELPAGLMGDTDQHESAETAVRRELLEETGYECREVALLAADCPTSAGLTSETVSLYHAKHLTKIGAPQGDGHEQITLHEIPIKDLRRFLTDQMNQHKALDLKIFAALQLAGLHV